LLHVSLLLPNLIQARAQAIDVVEEAHYATTIGTLLACLLESITLSINDYLQIQFAILTVHFAMPVLQSDCNFPKLFSGCVMMQSIFMFVMFYDFYRKAYRK